MKKISLIISFISIFFLTGCLKRDNLENITIYTTSYPIEYITEYLYGEHSEVLSIYPVGVEINNYSLNKKQIQDYSKGNMYIFNGLSKEKDYVSNMVNYNKSLMIIDAAQTIEYDNYVEELWLNPSNFLMMAKNIKNGLSDYITNHYLKSDIEEKYEELKIKISNIDAKLKLLNESSTNITIVTDTNALKFLEKYGFTIISLDDNGITDKIINDAKTFLSSNKYIYTLDEDNLNKTVSSIVEETGSKVIELHKLSNLNESEKAEKQDYITLLNDNIEKLKSTLYS